jgi:hypothetical protein
MKIKNIKFVLLFIPVICSGQIQFDFENHGIREWTTDRLSSWDTSSLEPISGKISMRHIYDNPDPGHDQVSFCIDSLHPEAGTTEWRFTIRHGYDPSSSNNWTVFLAADTDAKQMLPGGNTSGFAVGVNYQGSDDLLKLWKIDNGAGTTIITTSLNWQEEIGTTSAGLKVIRSAEGMWEILINHQDSIYMSLGKGHNQDLIKVCDFGVYYEYSSKQDCKLWMDDILIDGIFIKDTVPPNLIDINVSGKRSLFLVFSEPLDSGTAIIQTNFFADQGIGYPGEVLTEGTDKLQLIFDQDFPDGITCLLRIEGIRDKKGNLIRPSVNEFSYYSVNWFDIIINEIMADPSPPMGLPEFEYLELFNRSDHSVNLKDWTIECGNTLKSFPDIKMDPGSFLTLVYEGAADEFMKFGHCIPIFTSRTSLANSGGNIEIRNEEGHLISWTDYSDEWYENDYYRMGGWSLERIDPERFCGGYENWKVSTDPAGGTPGRINTVVGVNPDTNNPEVTFIEIPGESVIEIFFNEPMDSTSLLFPENYFIDQGVGNPVEIRLESPGYASALLFLSKPLEAGLIYQLYITSDMSDCNGNSLKESDSLRFAKPELPEEEDILISEIMFNPITGKSEFLEIFNYSSKTFDLSQLMIAEIDKQSGGMTSFTTIYKTHMLFFPGEFIVLTKDKLKFLSEYSNARGTILGITDLFSFDDEQGTILIMDKWLQIIDEFAYNDEMHFKLLSSTEGVSLERISYERPSNDEGNWHSAAENAGFCTPGYENSQLVYTNNQDIKIGVEPEIFTPDNDGREDFVNICYSFDQPGNVLSIWIFDPMGRIIRQLSSNLLVGTFGCVTWDGTDDKGQRARMGIYLIYVRLFDMEGRGRQIKKSCVLSVKK